MEKITLVKALREHASLSLTAATQAVDRCLRGETVSIAVPSRAAAEALLLAVSRLGGHAEIQQPVPSSPDA